jgi:hypothetical protein
MFKWILLLSTVVLAVLAIRYGPTLQRDIQRYIGMRTM